MKWLVIVVGLLLSGCAADAGQTVAAPPTVDVHLGNGWTLVLITGAFRYQSAKVTVVAGHQNQIEQARKGVDPDFNSFGFILKHTWRF